MANGIVEVCTSGGEDGVVREAVTLFDVALSERMRRSIVRALAKKAKEGDVRAIAVLFDRVYGRPGTMQKAGSGESTDIVKLDIQRLNEEEMKTFASLFEKCIIEDDSAERPSKGPVVRRRVPVSPRPSRVREGGAEGAVVAKAGRSRRSATPAPEGVREGEPCGR